MTSYHSRYSGQPRSSLFWFCFLSHVSLSLSSPHPLFFLFLPIFFFALCSLLFSISSFPLSLIISLSFSFVCAIFSASIYPSGQKHWDNKCPSNLRCLSNKIYFSIIPHVHHSLAGVSAGCSHSGIQAAEAAIFADVARAKRDVGPRTLCPEAFT